MSSNQLEASDGNVYSTTLIGRRPLTDKTIEIELTRPLSFNFEPGQRIRFIHHFSNLPRSNMFRAFQADGTNQRRLLMLAMAGFPATWNSICLMEYTTFICAAGWK